MDAIILGCVNFVIYSVCVYIYIYINSSKMITPATKTNVCFSWVFNLLRLQEIVACMFFYFSVFRMNSCLTTPQHKNKSAIGCQTNGIYIKS